MSLNPNALNNFMSALADARRTIEARAYALGLKLSDEDVKALATGGGTNLGWLNSIPVHIPDGKGGAYKTEWTLFDHPQLGTIKLNFWHAPDPRRIPHNHPWSDGVWAFKSFIIAGGFKETGFRKSGPGRYCSFEKFVDTDSIHNVNYTNDGTYHTVDEVKPGTITLMVCGPRTPEWGYLLIGDCDERGGYAGEEVRFDDPRVADPGFREAFLALNPMKRPA
jgi:hypothetical protein